MWVQVPPSHPFSLDSMPTLEYILKVSDFNKTIIQKKAIDLIGSGARNVMLYGGSRSGKTFINLYAIVVRACKVKSRHLILRLNFNHAKRSIWMDTLPKVMKLCFPGVEYSVNNSELYMTLPNGSEIWCGGLDNKERVEKILGNEYSTVFFNECSQLSYNSISVALTRLAEKNELRKLALYDENPPSKKHWSYWRFIRHIDPKDSSELDPSKYRSMVMNPMDNIDNIDEDYITEVLAELPERERKRFMLGEFSEGEEGLIYYAFDRDKHVRKLERVMSPIWFGMDFNVNPMTAAIGQIVGGRLQIIDEVYQKNSNTKSSCLEIASKYGTVGVNAVPDSTGKKRTTNASKSDLQIIKSIFGGGSVKNAHNPYRIDRYAALNGALEKGLVSIDPKCKNLINDLETLSYKEGSDMPDTTDPSAGHITDALGYLVYRTVNPLKGAISQISTQPR